MVCNRHPASGHWCLSLRVANIRKHQILKPSLRMVLTAVDSITPSNYLFEHLPIDSLHTQVGGRAWAVGLRGCGVGGEGGEGFGAWRGVAWRADGRGMFQRGTGHPS